MTKTDFFATTPKTRSVALDDGRTINVRKLSQGEVEQMKKHYSTDDKALEGFRFIVCRATVNDDGSRVFSDADQSKLAEIDFEIVQHIATEVMEFSGLTKAAPKNV